MIRAEQSRRGSRERGIHAASDAFYRGEIARTIGDFHQPHGGFLAAEDLAAFAVEVEPALRTTFRDYEVATCGFWCQGPVLLQMLNLLETVDLRGLGHNSPEYLHVLVETIKLAFADREAYYGDPLHVKVDKSCEPSRGPHPEGARGGGEGGDNRASRPAGDLRRHREADASGRHGPVSSASTTPGCTR